MNAQVMHTRTQSIDPLAGTVDADLLRAADLLQERARSLRAQADGLTAPLATAYRRRASELEFEAWVAQLQSGLPYDEIEPAA